jgi:hypothetical protein
MRRSSYLVLSAEIAAFFGSGFGRAGRMVDRRRWFRSMHEKIPLAVGSDDGTDVRLQLEGG